MSKKFKRIFTIVVDSLGIGPLPDSPSYGDTDVDTLGHIAERVQLTIPNLQKLGMANLKHLKGVAPVDHPLGYYCAMNEASNGKDTMTGHWEIAGVVLDKPFPTFPNGFPKEIIEELGKITGETVTEDVISEIFSKFCLGK